MYDKIKLCLSNADAQEIIPPKLENAKEQVNIKTGEIITFGGLQGLKVCVFSWGITIEGSLAKFLLPNNIYTLNRTSTQEAIEKLCDLLGLNIGGANVAALEYGTNFVMSKPVGVYLDKLGECGRLIRLPVANTSLYYKHKSQRQPKVLAFYDKIADANNKGFSIPKGFEEANLLRYEIRLKGRIHRRLNQRNSVTAADLATDSVYYSLLDLWKRMYYQISKHNQLKQNIMAEIKNPNQAFNVFVASLIAEAAPTAAQDFIEGLKAANVFPDGKSYTRLKNKIKSVANMEAATAADEDIKELTNEINNIGTYG